MFWIFSGTNLFYWKGVLFDKSLKVIELTGINKKKIFRNDKQCHHKNAKKVKI